MKLITKIMNITKEIIGASKSLAYTRTRFYGYK